MAQVPAQCYDSKQRAQKIRERRSISVASPLQLLRSVPVRSTGVVVRSRTCGTSIFRRVLGPGMAADAIALLAATNPEPAVFLANDVALCIEQDESNRAIGRSLHEK